MWKEAFEANYVFQSIIYMQDRETSAKQGLRRSLLPEDRKLTIPAYKFIVFSDTQLLYYLNVAFLS